MPMLYSLQANFASLKSKFGRKEEETGKRVRWSEKLEQSPSSRADARKVEEPPAYRPPPSPEAVKLHCEKPKSMTSKIKSTFSGLTGLRRKAKDGVTSYSNRKGQSNGAAQENGRKGQSIGPVQSNVTYQNGFQNGINKTENGIKQTESGESGRKAELETAPNLAKKVSMDRPYTVEQSLRVKDWSRSPSSQMTITPHTNHENAMPSEAEATCRVSGRRRTESEPPPLAKTEKQAEAEKDSTAGGRAAAMNDGRGQSRTEAERITEAEGGARMSAEMKMPKLDLTAIGESLRSLTSPLKIFGAHAGEGAMSEKAPLQDAVGDMHSGGVRRMLAKEVQNSHTTLPDGTILITAGRSSAHTHASPLLRPRGEELVSPRGEEHTRQTPQPSAHTAVASTARHTPRATSASARHTPRGTGGGLAGASGIPAAAASFLSPRDVSEISARKAKSGDMNGRGEGGREVRKEQSKEGIVLPSWARGGGGGAENERFKGSAWARNEEGREQERDRSTGRIDSSSTAFTARNEITEGTRDRSGERKRTVGPTVGPSTGTLNHNAGQDRKLAVYHAEDTPSEKSEGSALHLLTPRGEKERRSKNLTPRGVKERGMGEGGDDCRRELEKVPRLSKDLEKREARGEHRRLSTEARGEHRRLSTELERQADLAWHGAMPFTLTLDVDLKSVGDKEGFKRGVIGDVAAAAKIDAKHVKVTALRAGSVIVDMLIAKEAGDAQKIVRDLEEQLKSPNSVLMQGKLTSKTKKGASAAAALAPVALKLPPAPSSGARKSMFGLNLSHAALSSVQSTPSRSSSAERGFLAPSTVVLHSSSEKERGESGRPMPADVAHTDVAHTNGVSHAPVTAPRSVASAAKTSQTSDGAAACVNSEVAKPPESARKNIKGVVAPPQPVSARGLHSNSEVKSKSSNAGNSSSNAARESESAHSLQDEVPFEEYRDSQSNAVWTRKGSFCCRKSGAASGSEAALAQDMTSRGDRNSKVGEGGWGWEEGGMGSRRGSLRDEEDLTISSDACSSSHWSEVRLKPVDRSRIARLRDKASRGSLTARAAATPRTNGSGVSFALGTPQNGSMTGSSTPRGQGAEDEDATFEPNAHLQKFLTRRRKIRDVWRNVMGARYKHAQSKHAELLSLGLVPSSKRQVQGTGTAHIFGMGLLNLFDIGMMCSASRDAPGGTGPPYRTVSLAPSIHLQEHENASERRGIKSPISPRERGDGAGGGGGGTHPTSVHLAITAHTAPSPWIAAAPSAWT